MRWIIFLAAAAASSWTAVYRVPSPSNGLVVGLMTAVDFAPMLLARKRVSIGAMEASVTNWLADERLGGRYELDKVFINDIPARLEMIRQGKIDMACVPEPMASMGQLSGLEKRVIGSADDFCPDVMVFTAVAAKAKADGIRRFSAACGMTR
ncbi:MAG: hypothetical protein NT080_00775 [Spirochaetes bacterium]|nr:hypothetical protein [Spirochaetota bacterium]